MPRHTVAIGICTFRRPEGLEAALRAVVGQRFTQVPEPEIRILVIDNDADPAVEKFVSVFAEENDVNLCYLAEPRRGISQARNRFLLNIPDEADLVVFLDDDEVPVETWLDELIHGLHRSGADAISGPVLADYPSDAPGWLVDGKFFISPRRKDPEDFEPVSFGVMGNFLMRRDLLDHGNLHFPEELGLVGSEDSHFFSVIQAKGATMSWASRAVATHRVPQSRMSLSYLLNREFRVGCGKVLSMRTAGGTARELLGQGVRDFGRFLLKLALAGPACIVGYASENRYDRVKPLFDVWQFAGRLYGIFGFRYRQYR